MRINRTLDLPNPSLEGEYTLAFSTYGSGTDLHRLEYGLEVGFTSQAVDGSKLIDNSEKSIGWARTGFWGFGPEELRMLSFFGRSVPSGTMSW